MKKIIVGATLASVLLVATPSVSLAAETTDNSAKLAQIQELMKLIADLQAKLAAARGEVAELTKDLSLGAKDDDVMKVQELLASDPTLLKAKPTGYFGPMTEAALRKFQERYGLEVTGKLDEATRAVMKELRKERKDGKVPPGLVKSEEVKSKIKARLQEKWKDCDFERKFRAAVCEKVKDTKAKEYDEDDDTDESKDDSDDKAVTRDEARLALVDAQNELNQFRKMIGDKEEEGADKDEIADAKDTLRSAQKELAKARKEFARQNFYKSYEASQDVIEMVTGDDKDDDSNDDDDYNDDKEDDDKEDDD